MPIPLFSRRNKNMIWSKAPSRRSSMLDGHARHTPGLRAYINSVPSPNWILTKFIQLASFNMRVLFPKPFVIGKKRVKMLLASEIPRGSHEPNLSLWWCSILQTRSFNSLLFNTKYTVQYTTLCMVTQTSKWILTHVNKWIPTHECHAHGSKRVVCLRIEPRVAFIIRKRATNK